ncbi:hypothetical protein [Streptomyces sp. NPDC056549]|uniref:hypothetical protein n=1 Tax=Streptomyces sp. NPDC056549 TaxID=3345864 RepID=UPI0036C414FD
MKLQNAGYPAQTGIGDTLLPPKMAICDEYSGNEVVAPTAVGDIPSTLHPTKLEFADLPQVDLESKPDRTQCSPSIPPRIPSAPTKIELRQPDEPQVVKLAISGFRPFPSAYFTRLEGNINNSNRFDDLRIGPLDIWIIDRDGIARFSNPRGAYWDSDNCNLGLEGEQVIVPPAGTSQVWTCYPFRDGGHPAVAVVQYGDNEKPVLVRLKDPL